MAFPRTRKSLVSFNGGELSPKMDARNDTEKYSTGCRQFQNFLPLPHGGATRRRGFEYIAESKYSDEDKPARLLRFQFSQNDGLILELGDYYVRFFTRDGGPVMSPVTPSIPYEIATPYSSAQAFALQTAQVNDVVYITHPLFAQRKLTRLANNSWTLAVVVFDLPAFIDLNVSTTTLSVTPATVGTGRTMQASAALFNNPLHVGSYWRIGHHRDATTTELPITVNGATGNIPVLGKWTVNTYGTWSADIYVENSVDGGTTWERVRKYTSKADANVSDVGEQEDIEALYRVTVDNWVSSAGSPAPRVVFGVADGRIFGLVKITGVTDGDTATVTVLKAVYSTAATTYWNEGAWSEFRGYPTSLAFFQQRLWFGGSAYQPQTFWGSVTDDYEDFTLGTNADSGLAFTLASEERNQILWMVGQRRLVLGTSGGVWAAYGDELEAAITATKPPLVLKQNQIPCAYQRPIFINGSILFIQSSGRKLRELVLDGAQGIYDDTDLTVLSDQISAGGLLTPCYQQDRDSLVWCTTGLGNLVSMTYEKKQNVIAWARHNTPGVFESCDTIKGEIDDEVWVCVLRTINGTPKRFIERMKGYYNPSVDTPLGLGGQQVEVPVPYTTLFSDAPDVWSPPVYDYNGFMVLEVFNAATPLVATVVHSFTTINGGPTFSFTPYITTAYPGHDSWRLRETGYGVVYLQSTP